MKKLSTLLIAVALVLGFSQCKKKVETVTYTNLDGNKVHISLNVNNDDKHDVFVYSGVVNYGLGDIIYVGDGTQYLGYLEYWNGLFSGDIVEPATGDYLYFYFIGNMDIGLTEGGGKAVQTSYDFDICYQEWSLPVLSYGRATTPYTNENASYSCTLLNKCALVRITLSAFTGDDPEERLLYVEDMLTGVTIDFADPDNGIKPTGKKGSIYLHDEWLLGGKGIADERWAILLPQAAVNDASIVLSSKNVTFHADIPEIHANDYITSGIDVNNFYFSVGANKAIQFAPGNLQATYDGNAWSWHFAANDYDIIGNGPGNTLITNTAPWINGTGTVDLFGYSTAATYYGINSSDDAEDYYGDFVDWGTLQIDSYAPNTWRSLTEQECEYLCWYRKNNNDQYLHGSATVADKKGIVLLPDNWCGPDIITPDENISFDANTYTTSEWAFMRANGAVFLPAARRRINNMNFDAGHYWIASAPENISMYNEYYLGQTLYIQIGGGGDPGDSSRKFGYPVRLVR